MCLWLAKPIHWHPKNCRSSKSRSWNKLEIPKSICTNFHKSLRSTPSYPLPWSDPIAFLTLMGRKFVDADTHGAWSMSVNSIGKKNTFSITLFFFLSSIVAHISNFRWKYLSNFLFLGSGCKLSDPLSVRTATAKSCKNPQKCLITIANETFWVLPKKSTTVKKLWKVRIAK